MYDKYAMQLLSWKVIALWNGYLNAVHAILRNYNVLKQANINGGACQQFGKIH
jgi:hypothetical protein